MMVELVNPRARSVEIATAFYKFKECFDCRLHCQACVVEQHVFHPLHRIEVCAIAYVSGH
jgi:hypothetical protein